MSIDWNTALFFVPFIALVVSVVALILTIIMRQRVARIFRSASAPDIERLLKLHSKTLEDLIKFQAEANSYMKSLDTRIKKKIGSAPTLRFNPFQGEGVGGNQSFSTVLADEVGDGAVVTSMHTKERTNVFAKPLKSWKSEYELSEEEKIVIEKSRPPKQK